MGIVMQLLTIWMGTLLYEVSASFQELNAT